MSAPSQPGAPLSAWQQAERRAAAYLAQQGSALQRSQAAAWLAQRPLAPAEAGQVLAGQRPAGGWAAFWSGERCSVDATAYRITQALAAGLTPAQSPALACAVAWLAQRQGAVGREGCWREDAALAEVAPPWARPADERATLYLTANAGWALARCGEMQAARSAAQALASVMSADDKLPPFAQTQWLAAGLWLLCSDAERAERTLRTLRVADCSAGQLVWLLNCLLDSGLSREHAVIGVAGARLLALQQSDGSWSSDDGPAFTAQVTLEALRALTLLYPATLEQTRIDEGTGQIMKASAFDPQHAAAFSVEEGYTAWAATYDEMKSANVMDYPLLERIQSVAWEQLDAVADLACGTGRTGAWLKAHGVRAIDGVDLTEAMIEQARAKGIYRQLALGDLRQTPLSAHSYDLVSVGLADEHLPELLPLYQEAARLTRADGYLALICYHPFFQLSGVPTTFEQTSGELVTIEGYVHLFSEHVEAANACGWLLRELYERQIDEEWVARRPKAASRLGWPVSFVCLWQRQS